MRRGATKFERGLGRDWLDISDTADAVSAEDLCRLFHSLTETLRCQFVNGKVEWAFHSAAGCLVLLAVSFFVAFNSLIFRCSVRRLIPSFFAAAVTFPFVVANACKMSLRSVSWRSSGLAFSPKALAGEMPRGSVAPAACRNAAGKSRGAIFGPVAITTPCSMAVRSSRTLPGQL